MSFIYPLGFLGLLAIPIIVIIYLLRSKYKTKNVSSTFIWKRSLKYVKRKIPLNFIMSLILILQILTVVAATFAITRPTIKPLETEEKIIIVDASASMLTEQGGTSRFDNAIELVKKEAENISANHQITLILAGEEATTLVSRETDKGKVLTAIQDLKCTRSTADITGALKLAGEVLNDNAGAKIELYTDKEYIETDGVTIVDCKRSGEWNVGIISFEDDERIEGTEFVATLGNYGLNSSFSIKLLIDGKVVGQKIIEMENNEVTVVRFTHSPTENTGKNEVRIKLTNPVEYYETATVQINSEDSFSYDDSFTIYPKDKINPKVLYVSKYVVTEQGKKSCPNSFLYRAFLAAGYSINTSNMYTKLSEVPELKGYDLYIFEGVELTKDLPTDGAVWLLGNKNMPEGCGVVIDSTKQSNSKDGYKIETTLSLDVVSEIVKNVDLTPMKIGSIAIDASVSSYYAITAMGDFRPVLTASNEALGTYHDIFVAGNMGSVRMIVTSFDIGESSLGAFVSDFPILIRNMVSYSTPNPLPERAAPIGETISFNFPAGATSVTYNFNGELVKKIPVEELKYDMVINELGKYEIVVTFPDGDDYDAAVDVKTYTLTGHIPAEESMIVQRIPSESLDAPEPDDGAVETFEPVEIFPYIIALFILLLIFEWGVYYREQY